MNKYRFYSLKNYIDLFFEEQGMYWNVSVNRAKPGSKSVKIFLHNFDPEDFIKKFNKINCKYHIGYLNTIKYSDDLYVFSYSMALKKNGAC